VHRRPGAALVVVIIIIVIITIIIVVKIISIFHFLLTEESVVKLAKVPHPTQVLPINFPEGSNGEVMLGGTYLCPHSNGKSDIGPRCNL
jgi:hypothetical protein